MYLWNICRLRDALVENEVRDGQALLYLLAFILLWSDAFALAASTDTTQRLKYHYFLPGMTIDLVGTYLAYKANGGASGFQFLTRYFSLRWVLYLRLLPLTIAVVAVFLGLAAVGQTTPWLGVTLGSLPSGFLYWRLCHHIEFVASHQATNCNGHHHPPQEPSSLVGDTTDDPA